MSKLQTREEKHTNAWLLFFSIPVLFSLIVLYVYTLTHIDILTRVHYTDITWRKIYFYNSTGHKYIIGENIDDSMPIRKYTSIFTSWHLHV